MTLVCAACEKPLRKDVYAWTMGWSRADGGVNTQHRRDYVVRFHNKPECITVMTERMEGYAWDQRIYIHGSN